MTFDVTGSENKKYLFECKDSKSPTGRSLYTTLASTHAGKCNDNFRFYRPDSVQDRAHTFVPKGRPARPVLIGHDRDGEVVGRVQKSAYRDLSFQYSTQFPQLRSTIFYDSTAKRMNLFKSVDWVTSNLQSLSDYRGLGYIELGVNITNPDAIQKVLDERFLTVSVGFSLDEAICSVCHQDWGSDDKCEHRLGQTVDGRSMFLICGGFDYEEVSFVNFPADKYAAVINKDAVETFKDSLATRVFFLGLDRVEREQLHLVVRDEESFLDAIGYDHDIHLFEDSELKTIDQITQDIKSPDLTSDQAHELLTLLGKVTPADDAEKEAVRRNKISLQALIRKRGWKKDSAPNKEAVQALVAGIDAALAAITDCEGKKAHISHVRDLADVFEVAFTAPHVDCDCGGNEADAENWDGLTEEDRSYFALLEDHYDAFEEELEDAMAEEKGETEAERKKRKEKKSEKKADGTDSKLSTKERKSLKASSFCGPGKSFPVPDCAHVTAARRLIGRAKLSDATKEKILACVSRKAKSMGCGASKDSQQAPAAVNQTVTLTTSDGAAMTLSVNDGVCLASSADKEIFKANLKDSKQGQKVVAIVEQLHGMYKDLDPDDQSLLSSVIYALQDHWSSSRMLEYYKNRLASDPNSTDAVVPKTELKDLQDALEAAEAEIAKIGTDNTAALTASVRSQKRILAEALVVFRIASGEPGYKGLSTDQIQNEIEELSDRQLVSLKDSIADVKKKLPEFHTQTTTDRQTPEVASPVADNARVKDPSPADESEQSPLPVKPGIIAGSRIALTTADVKRIREASADRLYESLKTKTKGKQ